jgi:hypothetical protein
LPASTVRLSKILEEEKRQFGVGKLRRKRPVDRGPKSTDLASLGEAARTGKKIERDTSGHCQKCEIFNLVKYF